MVLSFAFVCLGIVLGSALTIQLLLIPLLVGRVQDRSTVTRITNDALKRHHTLSVLLLMVRCLFFVSAKTIPACVTLILLGLNLYQRFWTFTKLHLVKQPIGVQDLIQPDNVLREEFNRLQQQVYLFFRIHMVLLLIDLLGSCILE